MTTWKKPKLGRKENGGIQKTRNERQGKYVGGGGNEEQAPRQLGNHGRGSMKGDVV